MQAKIHWKLSLALLLSSPVLVGATLQRADVVVVGDEVLRQRVEQLRVGGRVGQREVVHGVDDAGAEVVAPDAVGEAAGEEGVFGRAHPLEP